ncbi:hypothetical protein DXG03_008280 [Asterophora parasitica]|uniref:BTB domain-containing protein n=1 Tax=Asterophora parasitica TaxID=117018 RepID=A0A9P7G0G4_9AGAR|nr:hypothetical protein DXG03_008280 [Asterophora parasitica]
MEATRTVYPPGSPAASRGLIRSDFWFLDGNIVIIAGPAAFKVHRGQLERHSDVFNDLFSIPQPHDHDLFEGCMYVELHDNPSDVFYFLSALYDGLYFKNPRANDFMAIASVLRLSTKYLVEHLRQRCLNRLALDWPSSLAGWDLREAQATDSLGRYMPRESCPHPVLIIELALDLGIPSILPAAFYDLSRYGPSKIMSGALRPPSALDMYILQSCSSSQTVPGPPPVAHTVLLTRENVQRALRGREHVQRSMANFIMTSLQERKPSADCHFQYNSSRPCHESYYFITLNILRSIGGIACGRDADTLFTLTQAMEMLSRQDFSDGYRQCGLKICPACKVDFAACTLKAREEVWASLPEWFGLAPAEEVQEGGMDLS